MTVSVSLLPRIGCFSDTGFFYALTDPADRWHQACLQLLTQVQQHRRVLVTTNFVIAETHALLLHRKGQKVALAWLDQVDRLAHVERVTEGDERQAKDILRRYADQTFTLTDALSFAVITRLGLTVVLSVDRHFLAFQGNFTVLPLSGTQLPP
jgi:predicted nucleic acid-binding protein